MKGIPMPPVPGPAKEVARDMAFNPTAYQEFGNAEGILPKAKHGDHYIEAVVSMGTSSTATGQYRVVCLVSFQNKVLKKYGSASHYGTGSDADKKPAFVEFQ
jgi:guanyl-specific ribonuclease Sa